ncbi:MAG: 3-hydroxybutyrate dehydrogenase [Thermoflexales bacterium]
MTLKNRTVLITGGGGGLGRAMAEAFAREGARVIIHDVVPGAREVADRLGGVFLLADLSDQAAVRTLAADALAAAGGRIDILINNAGFQSINPIDEFPEEMWNKMIQVMLTAPFQLIKYLLPAMKANRWGRIINLSSVHGVVGSPFKGPYTAAKHGILGLTRAVAFEVGEYGITVNALCPAYARTGIVEKQIADQARTLNISAEEVVDKVMLAPVAIKRLIEPEEVADVVAFLLGPGGATFTGVAVSMDLGWTAR